MASVDIWQQDLLDKRLYEVDFSDVLGSSIAIDSVLWANPSEFTAQYTNEGASISGTRVRNYYENSTGSEGNEYTVQVTITTDETIARKFTHTFKIRLEKNRL